MKRLAITILFLGGLMAGSPASLAAEPGTSVTERQWFRAYPYADRAQQLADAGEHERAIEAWERALNRAPGHPQLLRGLINSLIAIGEPDRALALSHQLPDHQRDRIRDELRLLALDNGGVPDPTVVARWLLDTNIPHVIIHRAAKRVEDVSGNAATADWLEGLACDPADVCVLVLEYRLEYLQRSRTASPHEMAALLAELDRRRGLTDAERALRIENLLATDRFEAARAELARIHDDAIFLANAATLIDRGSTLAQQATDDIFRTLERRGLLLDRHLDEWLRLKVNRGEGDEALALAAEFDRPCLDRVELARKLERLATARELLARCSPESAPARWAWLVANLEAWSLLTGVQFADADAERLRLDLLVEHYLATGNDVALATLLADAGTRYEVIRAGALERLGRHADAADIWTERYQRTDQPAALNQASFLLVHAGQTETARALLLSEAPFGDGDPGRELTDRLLDLLMDSPEAPPVAPVRAIVEASERPKVHLAAARLLARDAQCEAGIAGFDAPRFDLYAGTCMATHQPDRGVERLQRAMAAGEREALMPLITALAASGSHAEALSLWRTVPPEELTETDRLAWLQTAIAAGDAETATEIWARWGDPNDPDWLPLGAATAELAGDIDRAKHYWRTLHEIDPGPRPALELAAIEREAGNRAESTTWMRAALERTPRDQSSWLNLGYLLIEDDPDAALEAFEKADRLGPLTYDQRLQLGYLQAEAGDREAASASLRTAIDRMDSDPPPAGVPADTLAEQRFSARRTHEALQREWEFGVTGWLATDSVPGELVFPDQAPRNHIEARVSRHITGRRPDEPGPVRGVARVIAEGTSDSPYNNRALGVGLQWQPFHAPLVLRTEWLEPRFGDGDWVFTAATQILGGGRYRGDWRPTETHWWERKLYAEASWWDRSDAREVLVRYDHRYHWRWSKTPGSWFVYGLGEARAREAGEDVRVGLGLGLRTHSGADRYNAWRQRHSLRLEATRTLTTDLADRSGLFLRFATHW